MQIAWESLTAGMLMVGSVRAVKEIADGDRGPIDLPSRPGVYAFWWMGVCEQLMGANRRITLKGPRGDDVVVHYHDWWPSDAPYPCLYVGKTTDLKARFSQHLMRGIAGRAHPASPDSAKVKARNTSCQLRFGIEHVFPAEPNPPALIQESVGFSYCAEFSDNAVAERFFAEDRLVGHLRPWFNIDSER
ncbi:hypothetical protein R70211_07543 [Paraburkholderia domus]|uniref:GIY-YIG domain-containing protein n=1 Tax=Paraburkholderia domus TaxID=2793075 RepID=A0A9N8N9Z3_9BURK|nr:hypothetical protein R70211_07543 [Paraburkholderia domus]